MELGAGKAKWKRRGVGRWVGGRDGRDVGKGVRESWGIGRLITPWPRILEGAQDDRKADSVGGSLPEKIKIMPKLPGSKHVVQWDMQQNAEFDLWGVSGMMELPVCITPPGTPSKASLGLEI